MRSRLFMLSLLALALTSIVSAGPLLNQSDLGLAKSVTVGGQFYPVGSGGGFSATVGSNTNVNVWCVDVNNTVPGGTYLADVIALGAWTATDKSHVQKGNTANNGWRDGTTTLSALQRYQMAAYLVQQYDFFGASPAYTDSEVQRTIWGLMFPYGGSGSYPGENNTYFATAKNYVLANPTFGFGTWAVISGAVNPDGSLMTDSGYYDPRKCDWITIDNTHQTFLAQIQPDTQVPEPGTYLMLGMGLLGLGALRRSRR